MEKTLKRGLSKKYNFFKKNHKGLSTIIATLITIVLVLVATGIVWSVIRKVIQQGTEQVSLGKFTLNMEIKQVQAIEGAATVKVKRNSGEGEITGIKFIFDDGKNTEIIEKEGSLEQLQEKTYDFVLTDVNGSNLKKVSIAPVFKLESGKEITGDIKDELEIKEKSSTSGYIPCTPNCIGKECGSDGCGNPNGCGTCSGGYTCNGTGQCVASCTDTCASLGYDCGIWTICGVSTNCSVCSGGYTCNATGKCIANAPSLPSGLVSWWKFDGNTSDSVGTNHGTASGGPTLTSTGCKKNQCYSFDGINDYIYTANQQNNPQEFTISAWFKSTYADGHKIVGLESSQTGESSTNWDRMLYIGTDGLGYFGCYDGSGDSVASPSTLNDGNWHHMAGIRNDAADTISLYIDGVLRGSTSNNNAEIYNGYWRIAAYANGWWINSNDGYFHGTIDELMLWNRALNSTEVSQVYNYFN